MRHLKTNQLVDLLDGCGAGSAAAHLERCDACRRQLAQLRTVMASAAEVDVPEPSPQFWDHFSARVRERVASEGEPDSRWRILTAASWKLLPVAGALAAVVALAVSMTRPPTAAPPPHAGAIAASPLATELPLLQVLESSDDPSLSLVADLASDIDWDDAVEAGLATSVGGAEGAVAALTDSERRELRRLLNEALAKTGA